MADQLLLDGSLENSSTVTTWDIPNNCTYTSVVSGTATQGARIGRLTLNTTAARRLYAPGYTSAAPGDVFSVGVDLGGSGVSDTYAVGVRWETSGGLLISEEAGSFTTANGALTRRTYTTGAAPATTGRVELMVSCSSGTSGRVVDVDAALLTRGTYSGAWLPWTVTGSGSGLSIGLSIGPGIALDAQPHIFETIVDDASSNIVYKYMDEVRRYADEGVQFMNHVVFPSCGPSRLEGITGWHAWQSGLTDNEGIDTAYRASPLWDLHIGTVLQDVGYRTIFCGKPWNEIIDDDDGADPLVGWDEYYLSESGVGGFNWTAIVSEDGGATQTIVSAGEDDSDYFDTKVRAWLTGRVQDHFDNHPGVPLYVRYCPFTGHGDSRGEDPQGDEFPAEPMDRDLESLPPGWDPPTYDNGNCGDPAHNGGCQLVTLPDPPGAAWFNRRPINALKWMKTTTLGSGQLNGCLSDHKERIQAIQAANRTMIAIREIFEAEGQWANTLATVEGDNGYHLGECGMRKGKGLPEMDFDSIVTMVVRPPNGVDPIDVSAMSCQVDMPATYADYAGATPPADWSGRSLRAFLEGGTPAEWRLVAPNMYDGPDLDAQIGSDNPSLCRAIRTIDYVFAEYRPAVATGTPGDDRAAVYYRVLEPWHEINRWSTLSTADKTELTDALDAIFTADPGDDTWDACLAVIALDSPDGESGGDGTTKPDSQWTVSLAPGWTGILLGEGGEVAENIHRYHTTDDQIFANLHMPPGTGWGDPTITMRLKHVDVNGEYDDPGSDEVLATTIVGVPGMTTTVKSDSVLLGTGAWRCLVEIDRGVRVPVVDAGFVIVH